MPESRSESHGRSEDRGTSRGQSISISDRDTWSGDPEVLRERLHGEQIAALLSEITEDVTKFRGSDDSFKIVLAWWTEEMARLRARHGIG